MAVYGIRLSHHGLSLRELCDYVAELPAGCALWQAVGGPMAWSEQVYLLHWVDYRLRVADWRQTKDGQANRNQPKAPTPPPYAFEKRVEESRQSARAQAWEQRQTRLHTT